MVWMLYDAIKGLCSWVIGRSGTVLTVRILGKEGMFWIISQYLIRHLHDWKILKVFS